jgi:hypothetical protein
MPRVNFMQALFTPMKDPSGKAQKLAKEHTDEQTY